ncbi:MAG TPA: TIGR04255 family protein, partial [Nitrospira sp.]|nr:TIGR04255 family protein [Nitrospira sp.]
TNIMTLSTGQDYQGIDHFATLFAQCLSIAKEHLTLRRCDRIGVRFLDLVPDADQLGTNWQNWFKGEIVGWPASDIVGGGTSLVSSVSQTHLSSGHTVEDRVVYPGAIQAIIRHGVANADSLIPGIPPVALATRSFFLDLDFFVAVPQKFEVDTIQEQFRGLHSQADRFFRWSLTADGE